MASILLVLDFNGTTKFDAERVRRCLERLPGVRDWSNRRELFCEFDFGGDSRIVNLINESRCISVEGMGDASLQVRSKFREATPRFTPSMTDARSTSHCQPSCRLWISKTRFNKAQAMRTWGADNMYTAQSLTGDLNLSGHPSWGGKMLSRRKRWYHRTWRGD